MLLKAGTYRFNDVLTPISTSQRPNINFYVPLTNYEITQDKANYINQLFADEGLPYTVNAGTYNGSINCTIMWVRNLQSENLADENILCDAVWYDGCSFTVTPYSEGLHTLIGYREDWECYRTSSGGTGWGYLDIYGIDFRNIVITEDTEVDDTFGTWYISNTNYNEVNPTEDTEYIEVASWYTRVANAIRSKKGTSEPILRDDFASEIESISVGSTLPVYDGTVVIEKAESVLGLRRFKESMSNVDISNMTSLENLFEAYGFVIEDVEVEEGYFVNALTCTFVEQGETRVGARGNYDGGSELVVIPLTDLVSLISTFNVLSTANSTVDEWLLANTEGVSV